MNTKEIIKSQYHAALMMLKQALEICPDSLWLDQSYNNKFWHVAYHSIFYTHFYLSSSEQDFTPWISHRKEYISLEADEGKQDSTFPFSKEEILVYHRYLQEQIDDCVDALELEGESGFYWLPFNKLELQFYNIRHLQHHTGELYERLGEDANIDLKWVGLKSPQV